MVINANKTMMNLLNRHKWHKLNTLTGLRNKEILDGLPDFVTMQKTKFENCSISELDFAYQMLVASIKPTYSGSVDHRINTLDIVKTRAHYENK
jgi:hypothetical protein